MTMTYSEQLKHPNWQRVRLQVLERAGFKCGICGNDDATLHVHHKRYIKGRKAWEYELTNFDALCEVCHECAHKAKDRINDILAALPSARWEEVADTMLGWAAGMPGVDKITPENQYPFAIGVLASELEFSMTHVAVLAALFDLQNWDRQSPLTITINARQAGYADDDFGTKMKDEE